MGEQYDFLDLKNVIIIIILWNILTVNQISVFVGKSTDNFLNLTTKSILNSRLCKRVGKFVKKVVINEYEYMESVIFLNQ